MTGNFFKYYCMLEHLFACHISMNPCILTDDPHCDTTISDEKKPKVRSHSESKSDEVEAEDIINAPDSDAGSGSGDLSVLSGSAFEAS
jgi:hypothetical protein